MSHPAIKVENLGKRYRIGAKKNVPANFMETVTGFIGSPFQYLRSMLKEPPPAEIIWALKNISFEVGQGEVVGIVGSNGAGKSTLLKVLTRITEPTEGQARLRGRVGSLLEVGTGFHPELTGRENVYMNGAVLGMKRVEIKRKFDEIVDFSGVEKFIDTPVKRYSSGMKVRLGFAVAAHLEPEILLVDEVLAVGDAGFQRKCMGKMNDVSKAGRTVLLVSHNMQSIVSLCPRTIWLDSGKIMDEGPSGKIVKEYLAGTRERAESIPLSERSDRTGNGALRFTGFEMRNEQGSPIKNAYNGETVDFVINYVCADNQPASSVSVALYLKDESDRQTTCFLTAYTNEHFNTLPPKGEIICRVPRFPLVSGIYSVKLQANVGSTIRSDIIDNAATIEVLDGDFFGTGKSFGSGRGTFMCEYSWRFIKT